MRRDDLERGEPEVDRGLPLGWLRSSVTPPTDWEVRFVEAGACLRFRRPVEYDDYSDVRPPGYPGVGVTSGKDWWSVIGDDGSVIREADEWFDPDESEELVAHVEEWMERIDSRLDRRRIRTGCEHVTGVGEATVDALYDAFGTAEGVESASKQELVLVDGVGEATAERLQRKFGVDHPWEVRDG